MNKNTKLIPLSKMTNGQDGDCFVVLAAKEESRSREGKTFFKLIFRDLHRDAQCLIWNDSSFFRDCRDHWTVGQFYKIRTVYRETSYGPRVEIHRIRETNEQDRFDGFDPRECRPSSRIAPEILLDEILLLARNHIVKSPLLALVQRVFKDKRTQLCDTAASRIHHHSYPGGLLEHTLSVTKIAIQLVDHFQQFYPEQKKNISKPLVVAGAIMHDLGKLDEMESVPIMPKHTTEGELIGHFILGRDLVRQFGPLVELNHQTQLQLEHIVLSHSRFPDWGTPRLPMSLEALIVHYADYADATFSSALRVVEMDDVRSGFTNRKGPFGTSLFGGFAPEE
ncbi:MAG: HD domain-containing protein [Thermoguttaceae bacterium]|nr:HD domain-containing protein [Thermoguttaceae bacterium]